MTSPTADDFVLDYGSGTILVEMDDWDSYGDAYGLMDGDRVTVFGRIDDDFFEVAKVEEKAHEGAAGNPANRNGLTWQHIDDFRRIKASLIRQQRVINNIRGHHQTLLLPFPTKALLRWIPLLAEQQPRLVPREIS